MKTQKLTLVAVLATTLLSTSAFADIDIKGSGSSANATIVLTLEIDEKCTIHGLTDNPATNLTVDATTQTATINDFYAGCNTTTQPKIQFSSKEGSKESVANFELVNGTSKIAYGIKIGTNTVTPNVNADIPAARGTDLTFTTAFTKTATTPKSGTYQDVVTATITL